MTSLDFAKTDVKDPLTIFSQLVWDPWNPRSWQQELEWWGSENGLGSMWLGYVTRWSCPVTGHFCHLRWEGSYLGETTVLCFMLDGDREVTSL